MFSQVQKQKLQQALSGKYLGFFFLWIVIFSAINFFFNEIYVVGFGMFHYDLKIIVPFVLFSIFNTLLIALSINLIVLKIQEIKKINPGVGIISLLGIFFALLTGACPGCVAGIFPVLVGLLGSNMTLYSLPLWGIEIQLLSFAFLLIGIYFLSKDMTCTIPSKTKIMHKKKLISIIVLALVGAFNAAYLTYYAFQSKAQVAVFGGGGVGSFACDYNDTFSCSSVFNEGFAWILGVPFSAIALVVYPTLAIIALLGLLGKIKNHFKILVIMALGGLLFNGYIIYNEYVVGVYCALCLMCTAIIIAIGIMSKIAICKDKKKRKENI